MTSGNNVLIDDPDDDIEYLSLSKHLEDNTLRDKNKVANEFIQMGNDLLFEVEEKNAMKEIEKDKLIKYILKHSKTKFYIQQLKTYSYNDVKEIYNDLKDKRNFISKAFHFIFFSNH
jgi:hypothetical protein